MSGKKKKNKPVVAAGAKQTTRTVKQHAEAVRRWLRIEDEALDVLRSLAEFAKRLPVAGMALDVPRVAGALARDKECLEALVLKHVREQSDLAAFLERRTRPEMDQALDDMEKHLEACLMTIEGAHGWDPTVRAGSSPMSPCEMVTWTRQITVMLIDETWRKRVLLEAACSAAQRDDDDRTAVVTRDAVRLWSCTGKESFVDYEFLERFLATVQHIL